MENKVENLLIIYSEDEGKLKILLEKNNNEPYKNYWIIPGEILDVKTTQMESSKKLFKKITSLNCNSIIQGGVFSDIDRKLSNRTIAIISIVITDKNVVDMKRKNGYEWFEVSELPKLAYDYREIIENVTKEIKIKISENYFDILLDFFPSDFTLPEFQNFYENILGCKVDRRNFRKKIMTQKLVIDTGEKTKNGTGRPGTLYRFNIKNMKGKKI